MERNVLLVCSIVGFLGLLVAATGFAAEGTRVKVDQVNYIPNAMCEYPRSPAMGLGITAAISLLIAQLTINVSTGCVCCRKGPRPSHSKWRTAVACCIISWFTFVISLLLFLSGATLNDRHGEESFLFGYYNCYVLKPGVFTTATILSIASLVLGVYYYLLLNSSKSDTTVSGNPPIPLSNIALGQPQFPPHRHTPPQRTEDPVFVHEDTYMRRQYT